MTESTERSERILIGVSSCLLGQEVRYDSGHKHNAYLTETLARYFEFIPICPEMAIGLGTPRPPMRLVASAHGTRAVRIADPSVDVTDALSRFGRDTAAQLGDVSGYILKKGSPSCGMERVKIFNDQGVPVDSGTGVYAQALMRALPQMPVEEEGRLMDPVLRENFIERVFVYHRWQGLLDSGLTPHRLVDFHTDHKFAVLAHDAAAYEVLGRIAARAGSTDLDALAGEYGETLMSALKRRATRKRHANVLMHVAGFLKSYLEAEDKQELLEVIERYRGGLVPLIVPITLLRHHLRRHPNPYIERQTYMNPHPEELMLRNSL